MNRRFSISLKNRLAVTYAVFISVTLGVLILAINHFAGVMFNSLVMENIAARNREIVNVISGQRHGGHGRRHMGGGASPAQTLDALGEAFAQQGHIISIRDASGNLIWDARANNGPQIEAVMQEISSRMRARGVSVQMQTASYTVQTGMGRMGALTVNIETFGPFFYSQSEAAFLASQGRLLFLAWVILTALSIAVSVPLSRTIARPILKAKDAAHNIARVCASRRSFLASQKTEPAIIRVDENYHTLELAELSMSINSLSAEIEEGERRQKQLVNDIAHELRTPLSCLQGTMEAMIDSVYPADKRHLESCHEEIVRLSSLVSDLNTLTSFEWNKIALHKTEFDLAKLLDFTARHFMPAAGEKGIEIKLALKETFVIADYERLKQVFVNILSNALKYTDKGNVSVSIEDGGGDCFVTIADTGIGIAKSDLPHIFERFYRSDKSRSRDTGGAGIGLSIAAAIIAAHGGAISAGSVPESGTEFRIRLAKSEGAAAAASGGGRKAKFAAGRLRLAKSSL